MTQSILAKLFPRKRQKTFGFQMFSAGIEMGKHWAKMG